MGITPVVEAFGGECCDKEINRLVGLAATHPFAAVVGAGGGKTSDTARAVADELDLPVVITPTLASTDSPCSALSVIYTNGGGVQGFRFYNRHPLLLLVDTEVVARAPKRQLVAGFGDALEPAGITTCIRVVLLRQRFVGVVDRLAGQLDSSGETQCHQGAGFTGAAG